MIFCLNTKESNDNLFLVVLSDEESPRNKQYLVVTDGQWDCLLNLHFSKLESQWRIRGKVKSMEHGAFQILEDSRYISKLKGPCCNHELTNIVDYMGNV